jgi:neopullulanase
MPLRTLILAAVLLLAAGTLPAADAVVERVEPPHWWVGMRSPALQLLLHGKDIARLDVRIEHATVRLAGVQRGDSPNYLFVDLTIPAGTVAGELAVVLHDKGDERTRIAYPLRARDEDSAQRQGFGPRDLIYLLVPDRFANGEPGNDVVAGTREARVDRSEPGARHGGDLRGMTAALDYLASLGVTQVWPTPLVENDMPAYSYHGYAATDLYRIDPRFGSHADYLAFTAAAKARGIGVIQDIVLNHIGSSHWWMADPPTRDWINFDGRFSATNHARTSLQDPYAARVDRRQFNDGWFVPTMPDLNQRQPLLATYLIQNSLWWIEEAGLSGIREDTYPYADPAFLSEWGRRIREEYPQFAIVGEEWSSNPLVVSYWQAGNTHRGYVSHTPSMIDFPLYYAMLAGLGVGPAPVAGGPGGLQVLYEALGNDWVYPAPHDLVLFGGNHDVPRLYSLLGEDLARWKQAVTFLLTTRRIPQVFYGDEVLLTSPVERDDGRVRGDFPGGWPDDARSGFTGKGLTPAQREAQAFFRRLASFRKGSPALADGELIHFAPADGVYVYVRRHARQHVLVALSTAQEAVDLDLARFAEALPAQRRGTDVFSGDAVPLDARLAVPARGLRVIALP